MSANRSDLPLSMSQPKVNTRCKDSVAWPGVRPSCRGSQSEHSCATAIANYHHTSLLFMSSFRYSREITPVQHPMLYCHTLPRACPRIAKMLLWVQHVDSEPRFESHTEMRWPGPFCIFPWPCKPVRIWTSIQLHNRFHPSHRGGTPDTVIYDASFPQNARFAVGKKRKEA